MFKAWHLQSGTLLQAQLFNHPFYLSVKRPHKIWGDSGVFIQMQPLNPPHKAFWTWEVCLWLGIALSWETVALCQKIVWNHSAISDCVSTLSQFQCKIQGMSLKHLQLMQLNNLVLCGHQQTEEIHYSCSVDSLCSLEAYAVSQAVCMQSFAISWVRSGCSAVPHSVETQQTLSSSCNSEKLCF